MMVIAAAAIYFMIRFGLPEILKRLTVHRGVIHSLPTALIFGELAFLLASGADERLRLFKAGAVMLGFLSHLILDEIWSVEFFSKHPGFEKIFRHRLQNLRERLERRTSSTFAMLGLVTFTTLNEPMWLKQYCQQLPTTKTQQTAIDSQKQPEILKSVSKWFNSWR